MTKKCIIILIISILGINSQKINSECTIQQLNFKCDNKKEIKKKKVLYYNTKYCKMSTKSLSSNYNLIEFNVLKSFDILFDTIDLDTNKMNFLIEITMVESRMGCFTTQFSDGGTKGKGPWQINKNAFNATKDIRNHPQLKIYLDKIKSETGIDWIKQVQWEHCNYVFFGAITAQLLLIINKLEIHEDIDVRADMWKIYYNTYLGKGRPQDYLNRVTEIKNKLNI